MPDKIQILPDAVANQIAAGEVVQRPASVVKELLENAVDAMATHIKLIVKDGGRSFIQVTDNGIGMSETDARMSFERHATSKIRSSEDLFSIITKGFRGEALASIAAVAKVNMKTRRAEDKTGVQIDVEASQVVLHEPCNCNAGTVITVKSLFYNVPARRKFLKTDGVETRHIIDEFIRVALAHPEIGFELENNGNTVYRLEGSATDASGRQRIVGLFGNNYNERLVPVEESTDLVAIRGWIVKPEFARKTRGEQFFIVNRRFIRNSFLHHAVQNAFEDLVNKDAYPGYFVYIDLDPARIDINIHPTKTEIKFEDERIIHAILRSAVRKALGKYNITPTLDFDQESSIAFLPVKSMDEIKIPDTGYNPDYNPFHDTRDTGGIQFRKNSPGTEKWKDFYEGLKEATPEVQPESVNTIGFSEDEEEEWPFFQFQNRYIVTRNRGALILVDQHRAHERVLYEKLLEAISNQNAATQMELFPQNIELPPADFALAQQMIPELQMMGFDLDVFGTSAILVRGIPVDAVGHDIPSLIESLLENYKMSHSSLKTEKTELLARLLSSRISVKPGVILNKMEALQLVRDLFRCKMPYISPGGKPTVMIWDADELDQKFVKS